MCADRAKKGFGFVISIMFLCGMAFGGEVSPRVIFVANDKGEYTFDTGILRGTLRQGGKSQGLSSLTHIPSGAKLDRSMGIMSHYRVFTTGKRYGTAAWDWPGTAKLLPDGAVQTTWAQSPDRPFEMTAVYRWKGIRALDVETTVTARQDLSKFESFLASYFDEAFPSPCVYISDNPGERGDPGFLLAKKSYGQWQMFPRDTQVVPIIQDGRWKLEPNPVDWAIMPRLKAPLCLRRGAAGGPAVIVMAPPEDCFAIATPCEGEAHYSLYLSLFGRDIKAGQTAKARARFIIAPAPSDDQVVALYQQYINELSSQARPADAADKR